MLIDTLVVGGGPAGLVAATYLARFRRRVTVMDAQSARASIIPLSHNCPGFPEGIAGSELLLRLREQARRYGADIVNETVEKIERLRGGFFATEGARHTFEARTLILATGVVDIEPELPNLRDAIRRGLVRHCPICDGFEVNGQRTAVIGTGTKGVREAQFVRHFTRTVTLFTLGSDRLSDQDRATLDGAGIALVETPLIEVDIEANAVVGLQTADGREHRFDTLYSSLGTVARSELALQLGVACASDGMIITDEHQRTSVKAVYAGGDIVHDALNQIAVAFGHAAIAATDIHNSL